MFNLKKGMILTIERGVTIPMRHGTVLRTDILRPDTGRRHPVPVESRQYGGQNLLVSEMPLEPVWAAHGYAVVIHDVRGRLGSDGNFSHFVKEGQDGYYTVEWRSGQPCTHSGSGRLRCSQWPAADHDPVRCGQIRLRRFRVRLD